MKKNITVKILAFLALFGIVLSVVGTGILVLFGDNTTTNVENTLTPEDLQRMIDSGEIKISSGTTSSGVELK